MNPSEPRSDARDWVSFVAAQKRTGRSESTLKRAADRGDVAKRLLSVPGQRPQAQLYAPDLDRYFSREVHAVVGAGADRGEPRQNPGDGTRASMVPRLEIARGAGDNAIAAVLPVLAKLGETLERRAQFDQLDRKLTWNLREARAMTGLSRPALRELLEAHPDLAIRRGRRVWIKAGRLRAVLG
jgi:hypothetical protein